MKQVYFFILVAIGLLGMSSCSQDDYDFQNEDTHPHLESRAVLQSDSLLNEATITPLPIDSNLLKRAKARLTPSYNDNDYDEYFSSNMWNIRELPIALKSRGKGNTNNQYLTSNGAGKEITLANSATSIWEKFYLKILPASSGIPYLIYSQQSNTPLAVGQYDSNPNNKVLYAQPNASSSLYSAGWDLIPSTYKGYFAIQSESYLGQSDPNNMWSVFNHVLEVGNNNKIGYAQYTKKAQQEFFIELVEGFTLNYIEFHAEGSTVTKRSPLKLITYSENETEERRPFTIQAAHYVDEESQFSENTALKIPIQNTTTLFYRPIVKGEHLKIPNAVKPEDELAPIREKPDMIYSTTNQKMRSTLRFDINGTAPANSMIEAVSYLENYNVSADYTAYMSYNYNGEVREVKIKGKWYGVIYTNQRDNNYPKDVIKFYDLDDGQEMMRTRSITLSPIILK